MARPVPAPPKWLLAAIPLEWIVPLLIATRISVPYIDEHDGTMGVISGWVAFLLPILSAVLLVVYFRRLWWPVWIWLALNIVAGFLALGLIFLIMFTT